MLIKYQFKPLKDRATAVRVGAIVAASLEVATVCAFYYAMENTKYFVVGQPSYVSVAFLACNLALIAYTVTAVLFIRWLHRARCNIEAMGIQGVTGHVDRSIECWLVPFRNLIVPFAHMCEVYRASEPRTSGMSPKAPPELVAWWILWTFKSSPLGFFVAAGICGALDHAWFAVLGPLVFVSAAATTILFIRIVDHITNSQHQKWHVHYANEHATAAISAA